MINWDQVITADDRAAQELADWRGSAALSRAAFCNELATRGIVSDEEAISSARSEWPASMADFLSFLTATQARDVQIEWAACQSVQRMHPFVLILGSWLGMNDDDLDDLFGRGAA